jgi:tRNA/tmRNA/rRNA uracil-C5-methylase (TrmA/RlmC/RlmD family)
VTLGYRGRGTHHVVPVSRCEVAVEAINESLDAVRESICKLGATSGEVTILAGSNGVGWSMLSDGRRRARGGEEHLTIEVNGEEMAVDAGGFVQGNGAETDAIARHIAEFIGRSEGALAVELFAGSGTWTAGLLDAGYRVEAYELDGRARPAFEANTRGGQAQLHVTDLLETGVPEPPPGRPALVVLDPPRIGAAGLSTWIRTVAAPKVLMVSCDVATGLRDAAALCDGPGGYEIARVTSYDMFPNTGHQELVIELLRATPSE